MSKRPDELQLITGDAPHKYFHMMLNMADDDLDAHEYRLLGHYLRWAGHGGTHSEGIRTTAKVCHMGKNTIQRVRARLVEKGYLTVTEPTLEQMRDGIATVVTVIDRWAENIARYSKDNVSVPEKVQGVPNEVQGVPNEVQGVPDTRTQRDTGGVSNRVHLEEHVEEQRKEQDSRDAGSGSKIVPIEDVDPASYDDWMQFLYREFQVGKTSGPARHLYNMFKARAKHGAWKENNIMPAATLDEVRAWVAYEKRQAFEKNGKQEFVIRRPETINAKFLYWREKRNAIEAEKQRISELERAS